MHVCVILSKYVTLLPYQFLPTKHKNCRTHKIVRNFPHIKNHQQITNFQVSQNFCTKLTIVCHINTTCCHLQLFKILTILPQNIQIQQYPHLVDKEKWVYFSREQHHHETGTKTTTNLNKFILFLTPSEYPLEKQ